MELVEILNMIGIEERQQVWSIGFLIAKQNR